MNHVDERLRSVLLLEGLRYAPDLRAELASFAVKIWSREHRAWWGGEYCGYVEDTLAAGVYRFTEAYSATAHCGPEKGIEFHRVGVWSEDQDHNSSESPG